LTDQERADREMTEAAFQRRVIYRARKWGWKVCHFGVSMVGVDSEGEPIYATQAAGDAEGFPDLVLVKAGRQPIFAELKRELTQPTEKQWAWLDLLIAAGQYACVWRPSQLRAIEEVLKG